MTIAAPHPDPPRSPHWFRLELHLGESRILIELTRVQAITISSAIGAAVAWLISHGLIK